MQSVFEVLEWPKVVEHLESCCQTGYGRLLVDENSLFLSDLPEMQHELKRVDEAKILLLRYGDTPLQEPPDIAPTLNRLAKNGEIQSPEELGMMLTALKTLRQLVRFFLQNRSREQTPLLMAELEDIQIPNAAIEAIEALVTPQGELRESASDTYARLKHHIFEAQNGIKRQLQSMITRPTTSKYLQEPIITQREGRWVLPVKAEYKAEVPGIVHGVSATGVTLYVEPNGVVTQNNKLIALQSELAQEIRRILRGMSQTLFPEAPSLQEFVATSAKLDLLLAKARQSILLKANPVSLNQQAGCLHLRQAKHPLLVLQSSAVVANDIILETPTRVLLITGPNTGGKTVLLKLIGLFALMVRCGLHVPVAENSAMALFYPILADIGDPQSIAQSLSTFSGHMARLKSFLNEPDLSYGLILIDEICAGTDPEEGAALAQALLETFYKRGATTIVTTHIGELKVFAHQHHGYLNACVEFDAETLSPTYRLILGVPGTSNALNIASRLGISPDVIGLARQKLTKSASDSASLIESLELKNRQLAEELAQAKKLREEIQWEEAQLRQQLNRVEGEKKKTLQMYRESLKEKLRGIEQEVDDLKQTLRKQDKPDRQTVQNISGRFRKAQSQTGEVFVAETQKLYPHPGLTWEGLQIGDIVESRSLNLTGTIIEKHATRQEVTLQSGILKTTVPFSDIAQKVGKAQPKSSKPSYSSAKAHRPTPKSYNMECDVRGLNSDDALGVLEKFLDDAMVAGISTVGVIHGLGTGALKKAIRSYLKELPYIKSFGPAAATAGGDGKTLIEL